MAIPGRQVHSKFQPVFSGRLLDSPHYVSLAVFPRTALHAIHGLLGRPQTKSVVMLGDEDHVLDTPGLDRLHPLLGIELCGIEYFWIGGAVAPLLIEKCVGPE